MEDLPQGRREGGEGKGVEEGGGGWEEEERERERKTRQDTTGKEMTKNKLNNA